MAMIQQNDMYSKSWIVPHWKEAIDLRELFVLLYHQCNQNCPFCIEPKLHKEGFITKEAGFLVKRCLQMEQKKKR